MPPCAQNAPLSDMFARMKAGYIRLLILLATPMDDEDRTAIWSIPKPLTVAYFVIFPGASVWTIVEIVQVRMASYCGFVWTVAAAASGAECVTTWNALMRETAAEFAPSGAGIAIGTLIAMYGVAALMGIYGILTNTFTRPIIERHIAQGRTEGMAEGMAEGRDAGREEATKERDRVWREWNARRVEAEAKGLPFDEPTPDES